MTRLLESIDDLYRVFARYRQPSAVEVCPCGCTTPDATAHLGAAPLQELRFTDLADYTFSALTTQGSIDDFRYFLPRLFQGVAREPYGYNCEILFGKLAYAKWMSWPEDEVSALKSYLAALWHEGLTSFPIEARLPAFFEIETLISSIARTGEPLETYLQDWTATRVEDADEHLIQFVTLYAEDLVEDRAFFKEGFWADSQLQAAALRKWLTDAATLRRIDSSAHLLKQDGFEHLFPLALEALREQHRIQRAYR